MKRGNITVSQTNSFEKYKECDLLKSINHSNVANIKESHEAIFLQSVCRHFGRGTMSPFSNESFNKELRTEYHEQPTLLLIVILVSLLSGTDHAMRYQRILVYFLKYGYFS